MSRKLIRRFSMAFAVILFECLARAAGAATITVNTLSDESTSGDGQCSLREAITNAITKSDTSAGDCVNGTGSDTIVFSVSGTINILGGCGTFQIGINNVPPPSLTIDGRGQSVVLDGHLCTVFQLGPGATVNLIGLTITDGSANIGGGIGVFGSATLMVSDSTFSANIVGQGGGAIYNNGGTIVVANSTFSGNRANGGGAAIFNDGAGIVTVNNSTVSGNINGGLVNGSGTLIVSNTILSANTPPNCSGTITNGGYNISDDASCGLGTSSGAAGQLLGDNINALLDVAGLQSNGGSTQTVALQSTSPAIDAIPVAQCPGTDQRGFHRPVPGHNACDVGAYEFGATSDATRPAITIVAPTATTYLLNKLVPSNYSCTDPDDIVTACTGTVPNASNIDTASVGTKGFSVNATDSHNNSSSQSLNYNVAYNICTDYDVAHAKKAGSAVPIKLMLCDVNGANQSSSSIVLHATGVIMVSNSASEPLADSGNANPDFDFRFDPSDEYIFNLSTKGYPAGTFALQFTAGSDPTSHTAMFQLK